MQPNSLNNFDTLEHNIDAFNAAVGAGFWDVVVSNPMLYLGYIFAFIAAIGFITFFMGFSAGFPKVISMDAHDEHQEHHRVRVTRGFFILLYTFIAWEIVRWVFGGILGLFVAQ